ncbi:hypothetical protein J7K93_07795 [bacterium]|nr:hypothetical protein [bacterium]
MLKKIFLTAFYILCIAFNVFGQTVSGLSPSLHKNESFVADGKKSIFVLSRSYIIPGSVTVFVDSALIDVQKMLRIREVKGSVQFRTAPDSGKVVMIDYWYFPLRMKTVYKLWQNADTTKEKTGTPGYISKNADQKKEPNAEYGAGLRRSGSIFRGIEIGTNTGMRLQSGLRLQLSGKIMKGVEIIASLTDQNTPIQPEGNTQTLHEIDKVFITIKTSRFNATFGDYVFNSPSTMFALYSRKLSGAVGSVKLKNGSVTFFAAASRGVFTTNHFMGQEGNQGPYQLTGVKGERQIIVLAGTEKVWVNGESMTRGEDNDYTIEYGNGQIIFTRNRLITSDSRITVDFEYSAQNFQKEILGVTGEAGLFSNRIGLKASLIREADDKDTPLDFSITDEYKDILFKAGDNVDSAEASGAKYIGEDKGSYIKEDLNGKAVFRYVGAEKGDYTMHFSYVGSGKGDYTFQGYGIYLYEGDGKGSYLPVIFLPFAKSHTVADISLNADISKSLNAGGEVAVSSRDENLFSSLDDNDNSGAAYNAFVSLEDQSVNVFGIGLGRFGLSGSLKNTGPRFSPLGRMSEIEHGRLWGTEEGSASGEEIKELKYSYKPFAPMTIKGEFGSMERDSIFSERRFISASFNKKNMPTVQYQREQINTSENSGNGFWVRESASIDWDKWGIAPGVFYTGEHKRKDISDTVSTGFRFDQWAGKFGIKKRFISFEIRKKVRDDRIYSGNILNRNSIANTDQARMSLNPARALSASILYTHRFRDYFEKSLTDQKSDLADFKMRYAPVRGFVRSSVNYKFTSTSVSEMVRDTIKVGEGLGNYRFDENTNEFVPDPDGDVIFRTIQTGVFVPVNRVLAGADMFWNLKKIWKHPRGILNLLCSATTRSRFRVERSDKSRDFVNVNRLALSPKWGSDTLTVSGSFSQQHDIEYRLPGKFTILRFRFRKNESENNRLAGQHYINSSKENSIRLKGGFISNGGFLLEYSLKKDKKDFTTGSIKDRNIVRSSMTGEVSYRPRQKIEFAVKIRVSKAEDRTPFPVTKAFSIFATPRISYSMQKKGHIRAEFEAGRITSEPADRGLPYEMFGGDQPGITLRWRVLFTYKLSNHMQATFNYRGRSEPWRKKAYQTGQVEVRAFF